MEFDSNINICTKQTFSKNKYFIQLPIIFKNKTLNYALTFKTINSWDKDFNVKYAIWSVKYTYK